jgi:hypothetical protein
MAILQQRLSTAIKSRITPRFDVGAKVESDESG